MPLERDRVYLLSMNWHLVHPITPSSPLHGLRAEELARREAEVLILVKAFNRDFSQWVHARTSYTAAELVWNARFALPYEIREDGETVFDLRRLGRVVPVED